MSERLRAAYAKYDEAIREVVAAFEDESSDPDERYSMSGHYVTVVGLVRFDDEGGTEGPAVVLRPFGSQPSYITSGLLDEAVEIAGMPVGFFASDED